MIEGKKERKKACTNCTNKSAKKMNALLKNAHMGYAMSN
jgi:hypothetical protein